MFSLLRSLVGAIVVVALLVFAGGGYYYSSQVLEPGVAGPSARDMVVTEVDGGTISIESRGAPEWSVHDLVGDLQLGFATDRGYLRLRDAGVQSEAAADDDPGSDGDSEHDASASRTYEMVDGNAPAVGDLGGIETRAFPEDPNVLGLPFADVTIDTDLGTFAGWEFVGATNPDRWVVFTHGRGGSRGSALRAAEHVVGDLGYSMLMITHRNDPGVAASPDGHGHFGTTEWEELEAWLHWLSRTHAPQDVVLFGAGQGASITAFCLQWCEDIPPVSGAILDSPLLSLPETLDRQADDRGIPELLRGPLLSATGVIVGLRAGLDVGAVDHVTTLAELDLPILAFHGTQDQSLPISPTRALATRDPDQVTLVEYEGDHERFWNVDESGHDAALTEFLAQ